MIAAHSIKMDGMWYKAGDIIPLPKPQNEATEQPQYTKTEINRMSTAELQELADKIGIENAFETSGGTLKKLLIEHFGL